MIGTSLLWVHLFQLTAIGQVTGYCDTSAKLDTLARGNPVQPSIPNNRGPKPGCKYWRSSWWPNSLHSKSTGKHIGDILILDGPPWSPFKDYIKLTPSDRALFEVLEMFGHDQRYPLMLIFCPGRPAISAKKDTRLWELHHVENIQRKYKLVKSWQGKLVRGKSLKEFW